MYVCISILKFMIGFFYKENLKCLDSLMGIFKIRDTN